MQHLIVSVWRSEQGHKDEGGEKETVNYKTKREKNKTLWRSKNIKLLRHVFKCWVYSGGKEVGQKIKHLECLPSSQTAILKLYFIRLNLFLRWNEEIIRGEMVLYDNVSVREV